MLISFQTSATTFQDKFFKIPSLWYDSRNYGIPQLQFVSDKVLEKTWRHFTSLKPCKCSQIPHSESHQPLVEQKTTTIGLIIYKHYTHIKLCHLGHGMSEGKF